MLLRSADVTMAIDDEQWTDSVRSPTFDCPQKMIGCACAHLPHVRLETHLLSPLCQTSQHWPDARPASGHCVTSVRSVFLNKKHFHDFATFSTLAQMC
jgi:hypothetical protein